jgi:lipopolysaccharide transport system ATP-binding protein
MSFVFKSHPSSSTPDLPDDVVLSIRGVSKKFCRNLRRSMLYGTQDLMRNMLGITPSSSRTHLKGESSILDVKSFAHSEASLRKDEFWALRDVSFDLKRGETLGVVGLNGSGKTTLLRILSGIFPPDRGTVRISGRVSGLIALGAGFHPHMTGRENILLNGVILGMKKRQIEEYMERIMDFADIYEFIDAPVSTYSSGMAVRLGFAIASVQEPDVLLLDEVLAVGDAGFRNKCYNYIGKMQSRCAVILISHSMQQITQACSRAILLNKGCVVVDGSVEQVFSQYLNMTKDDDEDAYRYENWSPPVEGVRLTMTPEKVEYGKTTDIRLEVKMAAPMDGCRVNAYLYSEQGLQVVEWNSDAAGQRYDLTRGCNFIDVTFGPLCLKGGRYHLVFSLYDSKGLYHLVSSFKKHELTILGKIYGSCAYQLA